MRKLLLCLSLCLVMFPSSVSGAPPDFFMDNTLMESARYIGAGKGQKAISILTNALKSSPRNYHYHYYLAESYRGLNRYSEAWSEYKVVIGLAPSYPDPWHWIGVCYDKLGDHKNAVQAYKRERQLAASQPGYKPESVTTGTDKDGFPTLGIGGVTITHGKTDAEALSPEQREYEKSEIAKVKQTESRGRVTSEQSETYFTRSAMPLSVYMQDSLNKDAQDELREAFLEWSQATNGRIRFSFYSGTADGRDADILCSKETKLSRTFACGEATWGKNSNGEKQALVRLLSTDSSTCLHEIGHVLGLSHSSNPKDIMYMASGAVVLSENDKSRICQLYCK